MKVLPIGTRIWADNKMLHKQGRATYDVVLFPSIIITEYADWMSVRLTQKEVDQPLQDIYPDFWVEKNLLKDWVNPEPIPEPDPVPTPLPSGISDEQAAAAFVTFLKWCKQ